MAISKKDDPPRPDKITKAMLMDYLKTASVEPFIILFAFSFFGRGIITLSLFKDKACLVNLGLNHSICDNLYLYPDKQNQVQILANNYHTVSVMVGLLPAIIALIFLSSWSDNYGRKIPIVIATVGFILEIVGVIWNLLAFDAPLLYMVLPSIPGGVMGGILVVMTACVSYITDASDTNTRVLRFAVLEVAFIFASPMGIAICGVIYKHSGYLAVFLTCLGVVIAGLVFLVVRLKEKRKKKLSHVKEAVSSLFSLENAKVNFKTCTRKRPGTTRKEIWLIFLAMCCTVLNFMGVHAIEYFFVSKMYRWSNYKLSLFTMILSMAKGLVIIVSVPLLTQKLNVSDMTLSIIGTVSALIQTVLKAVSYEEWLYYLASVSGLLSGLANIGVRSRLSKLVSKEEIGKVFSVLTLCESLTPLIGLTVFSQIYNASVAFFPGLSFMISAIILIPALGVFIWIAGWADAAPFETEKNNIECVDDVNMRVSPEAPHL